MRPPANCGWSSASSWLIASKPTSFRRADATQILHDAFKMVPHTATNKLQQQAGLARLKLVSCGKSCSAGLRTSSRNCLVSCNKSGTPCSGEASIFFPLTRHAECAQWDILRTNDVGVAWRMSNGENVWISSLVVTLNHEHASYHACFVTSFTHHDCCVVRPNGGIVPVGLCKQETMHIGVIARK